MSKSAHPYEGSAAVELLRLFDLAARCRWRCTYALERDRRGDCAAADGG